MYNNFDYMDSVCKIKSALYDIYESQEVMIGEEQDEKARNKRVERYIETKDLAIQLLEHIESLYKKIDTIKEKNSDVKNSSESAEIEEPHIIQISKQDELLKEGNQIEDINPSITEENIEESVNSDINDLPKFYLDSRNGEKPNFAFVPETIFIKLKSNAVSKDINNKIYKQDEEEKKGIIVRKDQFMKLSLSKERQDGVLKEAKIFRIKQAKKSRQQLQNI